MKIGIMTFHAAHNFGAALQAYALCEWVKSNNVNAELINYQPLEMEKLYSINPFYGNLKNSIKRLIATRKRWSQIRAFRKFQESELNQSDKIKSITQYRNTIKKYDSIIYGSDQIWNPGITGDIDVFWGKYAIGKKIAYAASFGTDKLTELQQKKIKDYLDSFEMISVRESQSVGMIGNNISVNAQVVCDPVFLLGAEFWKKWARCSEAIIKKNYILYYSLRKDPELIKKTLELSKMKKIPIYIIHPIAQKQSIAGKQLYNVGPKEYVNLIFNSSYICTNSFHAVAFSCIFRKRVLHISNKGSKGRVESLMKLFNLTGEEQKVVDFALQDYNELNKLIEKSKYFLKESTDNNS